MNRFIATALVALMSTVGVYSQAHAEIGVNVVFSKDEIRIIDVWYRDHGTTEYSTTKGHGGGHKGNKGLPPGIAKNLARGKSLPPGIAKRYLPDDLRHVLPPPHDGYERLIIDGKVLLVEIATGVIHDILMDVVLN